MIGKVCRDLLRSAAHGRNSLKTLFTHALTGAVICLGLTLCIVAQKPGSAGAYQFLVGSTHAHTQNTWSHGDQFEKGGCAGVQTYSNGRWSGEIKGSAGCALMFVMDSVQYPGPGMKLRADWEEHQGPPAKHFELAKAAGYDFYVTTDHSQDAPFHPQDGGENVAWEDTKRAAAANTDVNFVALAGFEYSENDGPAGVGHINIINSAGMINALKPGMDLPHMYKWLETVPSNGEGPVVASFNHPGPNQYNDWDYRTPGVTGKITMLEVINGNNHLHYEGFIHALDKGWKVSPVCGIDNHGTGGIARSTSRTVVLATEKSKTSILDAMKNHRTYATLDKDLHCRYQVNGAMMGSTLDRPSQLKFDISIDSTATADPKNKITKIDIVKDGGAVVETYTPETPGFTVHWSPEIRDATSRYYFVRVWNDGGKRPAGIGGDAPVAWLAPVWTGR
jgi:hypothetical protein